MEKKIGGNSYCFSASITIPELVGLFNMKRDEFSCLLAKGKEFAMKNKSSCRYTFCS